MTRLDPVGMIRCGALAGMLCVLGGCQQSSEPAAEEENLSPAPEVSTAAQTIEVKEGELLEYQPVIANRDQIRGELVFEIIKGQLPEGCQFESNSGGLSWTPTELQGPDTYNLTFACHSAEQPADAAEYQVALKVLETNLPPILNTPADMSVSAGTTLEQTFDVADKDFPANQVVLELQSGPDGAVVDDLGKLLYWEVPQDWQQETVEFTVAARDNGTPPMTTVQTIHLKVTDIQSAPPKEPEPPAENIRVPEVAVELPPLPRPGDAIEPVPLELELDPPLPANGVRLSLMLPQDLRASLKMRYLDDVHSRLAIMLTDPFEAYEVPNNLEDGIVATCEWDGSKLSWTWALTIDLDARGYQNNLRHAVLVIEPSGGEASRLVALQPAVDVPAPIVESMLGNEKLQTVLLKHDRVKKSIALEGLTCTADNGHWQVNLLSQIDGFSLLLGHPELTNRVNSQARSGNVNFANFGFRVLPYDDEITIELDAKPSPAEAYGAWKGAQQALRASRRSLARWQGQLQAGRNALAQAQRLPEKNRVQKARKQAELNKANTKINQATQKVNQFAAKVPADENVVKETQVQWNAIKSKLEPLRNCVIYGEINRRIGDVRVPVLRLVPVQVEETESSETSTD